MDSSPLEKPFDQMTEDEKDKPAHDIVMCQFMFAQTLSCAISRKHRNQELERLIMEETIKEHNFLLEKKINLYRYNSKVHRPLCEEIEDQSLSYFDNSAVITFIRV